ncbi:MAG: hypothetical protein PHR68_05425, partial [Candidatus Gracilibacteria bacterium]|nr:hypothetical protein [Candidatus Gracilibacteria bacterium]
MVAKENLEDSEENNKQNKQYFDINTFNKSIDNFIENEDFIKDSNNLYSDYKNFLLKNENEILLKLPKEDENIIKIKERLNEKFEIHKIHKNEIVSNLEESINKNFNLSEEEKIKLSEIIKKEKIKNLKDLVYFTNLQEKFLKKNGFKLKSKYELLKLSEIGIEKIETLSKENAENIISFVNKIDSNSDIFYDELDSIFEVLDKKDKESLINHFIGKIPLSKLVRLGIIKEGEEKEEKLKYLNKYKAENLISKSISDEEGLKLINSDYIYINSDNNILTELSNILSENIPKENLNENDLKVKNQKDEIFGNILRGINQMKSDVSKEEYTSKIDLLNKLNPVGENENINDSFIDYVKKDPQLSYLQGSIDKLQKDNYIVVTKTDINTGKEYRFVQKINQVDCGTTLYSKSIKLENLASLYGILEKGEEKRVGYDDFYELLKSPVSNTDQSIKINLEFLDEEELKKLKEIKEIKNIVSDKKITNPADLQNKIDEIDPEGAGKGYNMNQKGSCSFVVGKPGDKDYGVYSIVAIDNKNVTLSSKNKNGKNESFELDDFFNLFLKKGAKRQAYVGTSDKFFDELLKGEKLSVKYEFKDNKFIEKTENKDEAREVKYMVGKDGKAIKIENIGHGNISICTGKYEEKKGKNKNTIQSFELSYPQTVSYED